MDGADRVQQRLVDLALEHVAGRAGLQRVEHVALVVVHRQREHLRLGQVRADLARGLQAGHARHRDVHHAQVGRVGERLLEGLDAVVGLGDDLHVGLALDQQLHAAADDAVVVGDQDPHVAPMVSSMVVPSPGAEKTLRRPPTSSARSRMPETPRRVRPLLRRLEAAAVVADAQDGAADERELDVDGARARVLDDVGQALLRDAVDARAAPRRSRSARSPWRWKRRADAGALAEVGDLRGERRHEAVVVERGRAQLAREVQQLLHRLRGERLDLLELRAQPGRRRRAIVGLQAQQDRGQRLVDLVVQVLRDPRALLLLGAQDGAAGLARARPRGGRACG